MATLPPNSLSYKNRRDLQLLVPLFLLTWRTFCWLARCRWRHGFIWIFRINKAQVMQAQSRAPTGGNSRGSTAVRQRMSCLSGTLFADAWKLELCLFICLPEERARNMKCWRPTALISLSFDFFRNISQLWPPVSGLPLLPSAFMAMSAAAATRFIKIFSK